MNSPPESLSCPVCDTAADPSHSGCEACGADLHAPAAHHGRWLSSAASHLACTACGKSALDEHGYCVACGRCQNLTSDRIELDLSRLGAATDFGKRHSYNQDAVAIGRHRDTSVVIVCDGVSSSTRGELAALAGVEAGAAEILDNLSHDKSLIDASHAGVAAAAAAAARNGKGMEDNPPSCTYVSAVLNNTEIEVTWVGDSRAYWVSGQFAQCLTVDDSHVGRLAAHGVPETDERYRAPYATALLAWLGLDAPALTPNRHTYAPNGPGTLVVCSDGLSGYFNAASDLLPLPQGTPTEIASALTEYARAKGGKDNITVAVAHFPPNNPHTLRLGEGDAD